MKKIILSAAALMTLGFSNAQLGTSGFEENWDNTEYENTLYWWSPEVGGFDFETSRADDGTTVTLTQHIGGFEPFGISFGQDSVLVGDVYEKSDKSLDFSGDKTFGFTVENLGTEDIEIRITLQDANSNNVDTYPTAINADGDTTAAPWEHAIEFAVDAGATETFSDTWEGATKATYDNTGAFIGLSDLLDFTAVTGLQITVFNKSDYDGTGDEFGENAWAHKGLFDYSVKFTGISAGDLNTIIDPEGDDDADGVANLIDVCPETVAGADVDADGCEIVDGDDDADGVLNSVDDCPNTTAGATVDATGCVADNTGVEELKAQIGLSIVPNPASDVLTVSFNGEGAVNLVSSLGEVVSSANGVDSATLNVSNLTSGVYYAVVTSGNVVVTERVLVK